MRQTFGTATDISENGRRDGLAEIEADYASFAEAIRRKLLREVAGPPVA